MAPCVAQAHPLVNRSSDLALIWTHGIAWGCSLRS